ncbi:MAG: P-loop NTPase [Isosphaeraceae bacterium]
MSDQADGLRKLVRERSGASALLALAPPAPAPVAAPPRARSLVLTSGKGGVGTSNLALNLAIALGELGERVVLVDADLGLANIDLLCGINPGRDLGDVLAGDVPLEDVVVEGPAGVRILPGAHGMRTLPELLDGAPARLAAELATFERSADCVIVDAGSGLNPAVSALAAAAGETIVVTTPEPTSIADAHAAIGRLRRLPGVSLRVVVSQSRSTAEAHDVLERVCLTSRQFLGAVVTPLGHVRFDRRVPTAVRSRTPFLTAAPHSLASRSVRRLARAWLSEHSGASRRPGFFDALTARLALGRLAR